MYKYRKRKIFLLLFILVIIGTIISSNYIWNVEIIGNVKISTEEIMRSLEESGLTIGTSKNDINTNYIINKIRLSREDIAWIGISIKGTNAVVKIKYVCYTDIINDMQKINCKRKILCV